MRGRVRVGPSAAPSGRSAPPRFFRAAFGLAAPVALVARVVRAACVALAACALAAFPRATSAADVPYRLTADRLEVRSSAGRDTTFLDGHVVFFSGETLLRAARGVYVGADQTGRFEGAVEIFHDGSWLLGPAAVVNRQTERLEFPEGVLVIDSTETIVADRGVFDLELETATFTGEVGVIEGPQTLFADSLRVLSQDEAEARGRVVLTDSDERARGSGGGALLSTGRVRLTDSPTLLRFDSHGEVESKISADTLYLEESGGAEARGRVRIERGATAAEAGVARIDAGGTRAELVESPRAFREGRELTGDTIVLSIADEEVREVLAEGSARLTRDERVSDEGKPQERAVDDVAGDSIRLEIEADSLRRAVVWGDMTSRTERRTLDGALLERNEVTGDTLILFTDAQGADRVRILGNAKGVYLPRPEERPAGEDSAGARAADTTTAAANTTGDAADSTAAADSTGSAPAGADSSSRVRYKAEEIEFLTKERRIVLSRGASLEYQGMALSADEVNYDLKRMALLASGNPILRQGGDEVEGRQMGYNLDEARGIVYKGRTHYDTGYLEGGEVVRMDASTLDVRHGSYTSCDLQPPHYHFASRVMRVYLDDKSVARPVVLYIRDVPIIALPFYILPLAHGRRSGFLLPAIEFGFSERRGRFVRNLGYYWATNDYVDFALTGDFYQNSRWTANLESNYALRYLLSGRAQASYSRETLAAGGGRRWDVHGSHNQQLGDRASLTARADFVSDATYRRDIGTAVEDLNRELKSDVTFRKNWATQSLSLDVTRREALDRGDVTERLPNLRYSVSRFPILGGGSRPGGAPWYGTTYVGMSANLVNARDKRVIQRTALPDSVRRTENFATEESFSLSNSMKMFGWLGLSPSADYREAMFDKDARGERWERRGVWSASTSASTNVYGTWRPHLGSLVGLRHIVAPSVSFRYAPDLPQYFDDGDRLDRFLSVSGIGGTPRGGQSLGISVQHTFQAKFKSGEKERSIDDLMSIGQSISRNLKGGEFAWSSLSTSVRLRPAALYEVTLSTSHNVYERVVQSVSIVNSASIDETFFRKRTVEPKADSLAGRFQVDPQTMSAKSTTGYGETSDGAGSGARGGTGRGSQAGPWRLSLVHNYSKRGPGTRGDQKISLQLGMNLTRGWRLDYAPFFDLRERDVISQRFVLVRDLHCWEGRFSGYYNGSNWEYNFRVQIRVHPDVGYERGRKSF